MNPSHPLPSEILDALPGRPLVSIYAEEVLPVHTRRTTLPGLPGRAHVSSTLLGYEVQLGRHRKSCPDLATARYLAIFASLGLTSVHVPYNPAQTEDLVPALEEAFERISQAAEEIQPLSLGARRHHNLLRRIYAEVATRIQDQEQKLRPA